MTLRKDMVFSDHRATDGRRFFTAFERLRLLVHHFYELQNESITNNRWLGGDIYVSIEMKSQWKLLEAAVCGFSGVPG